MPSIVFGAAIVLCAAATVADTAATGFFARHLAPVTALVHQRYANISGLQIVEVDACRWDPAIWNKPGGCTSMPPMTRLDDIGFLRALYTPGNATHDLCGPAVAGFLDFRKGNITLQAGSNVMEDICKPVGVDNRSRATVDEALTLAQKATGGVFNFTAINLRQILYPCISEGTMIFNPPDADQIYVGVDSRKVCKTAVTKIWRLPNGTVPRMCQDRAPQCYPGGTQQS